MARCLYRFPWRRCAPDGNRALFCCRQGVAVHEMAHHTVACAPEAQRDEAWKWPEQVVNLSLGRVVWDPLDVKSDLWRDLLEPLRCLQKRMHEAHSHAIACQLSSHSTHAHAHPHAETHAHAHACHLPPHATRSATHSLQTRKTRGSHQCAYTRTAGVSGKQPATHHRCWHPHGGHGSDTRWTTCSICITRSLARAPSVLCAAWVFGERDVDSLVGRVELVALVEAPVIVS